jgi:hypothetical protein
MLKAALLLPIAALVLAACQKPAPHATDRGAQVMRDALAKAQAAAGPQAGVTQISTTGSPRGFALKLPPPHAEADGRSLTISLPFRTSDGLVWTVQKPAGPWALTGSKTSPGAGPEKTDLAVFTFQAAAAGGGTLTFQLASPQASAKDNVMTYQATVVAP